MPRAGTRMMGSREVAGIGMASVAHQVASKSARPAQAQAASVMPAGAGSTNVINSHSGPSQKPMRAARPGGCFSDSVEAVICSLSQHAKNKDINALEQVLSRHVLFELLGQRVHEPFFLYRFINGVVSSPERQGGYRSATHDERQWLACAIIQFPHFNYVTVG